MKKLLVLTIVITSITAFGQSKKELKSENSMLKESIEKLQVENITLKERALTQELLVNSSFGTVTESDLIIVEGMYIDRKEVDPNSAVYKNIFYKNVAEDSEYRERILNTFGFSGDAKIIAISLKDCKANDYSQFTNSDAIRSISCKAVLIANESRDEVLVNDSNRNSDRKENTTRSIEANSSESSVINY
jgi:hypothetical protein